MSTVRFSKDHEWVVAQPDGTAIIGITDYAQHQLGELVYIELPGVGDSLKKDNAAAVVESVKSASDLIMPVSGVVLAVNEALVDDPEKVNKDAMGEGWFLKVSLTNPAELDELMDEENYKKILD